MKSQNAPPDDRRGENTLETKRLCKRRAIHRKKNALSLAFLKTYAQGKTYPKLTTKSLRQGGKGSKRPKSVPKKTSAKVGGRTQPRPKKKQIDKGSRGRG